MTTRSILEKRVSQGMKLELRFMPVFVVVLEVLLHFWGAQTLLDQPWILVGFLAVWLGGRWCLHRWGAHRHVCLAWGHSLVLILFHMRSWQSPETFFFYKAAAMFMPLALAMIIPLRPLYFMYLGLVSVLAAFAFQWGMVGVPRWGLLGPFALVGGAASAALATNFQRKMWITLDYTRRRLISTDLLSALGKHAAGLAHGLKTPFSAVMHEAYCLEGLLQEMQESIEHPDVKPDDLRAINQEMMQHLAQLRSRAERSVSLLGALHEHTQSLQEHQNQTFEAEPLLRQSVDLVQHRVQQQNVTLSVSLDSGMLRGDPSHLLQVVVNLLNNAMDAMEEQSAARLHLSSKRQGGRFLIVVQDEGPGVPDHLKERIFEPLFTTHHMTNTGLGLSLCRDIIEGIFQGTLCLAASDKGARFEVLLPVEESARRARSGTGLLRAATAEFALVRNTSSKLPAAKHQRT